MKIVTEVFDNATQLVIRLAALAKQGIGQFSTLRASGDEHHGMWELSYTPLAHIGEEHDSQNLY